MISLSLILGGILLIALTLFLFSRVEDSFNPMEKDLGVSERYPYLIFLACCGYQLVFLGMVMGAISLIRLSVNCPV